MNLSFRARAEDRGVSAEFDIAEGETVALLGPNGAGKSTILSLIAGLLKPDDGEIRLGGQTIVSTADRIALPPHQREVALLAQDPLLFPHLTVRDNVAFGPRSRGRNRGDSRGQADDWLDRVGIPELAERRPAQLSGGQAQRAAVARALAADPRLLLLDEPLAALDVEVAPELRQTLRRVLADRTTILVTHDVLDALLLADRVIVLEKGQIVEDGPSREVLSHPRSPFAAKLAGLNLISGTWARDHVRLADGRSVYGLVTGPVPSDGDPVVATFRPHAVSVFLDSPGGSPRNSFAVSVAELEPVGELVRVRGSGLSADITAPSVADLDLTPGSRAWFSVKATEVAIYAQR